MSKNIRRKTVKKENHAGLKHVHNTFSSWEVGNHFKDIFKKKALLLRKRFSKALSAHLKIIRLVDVAPDLPI